MNIKVPFADYVGIEIQERSEKRGVVSLAQRPDLTNHVGSQHAGALFTAAEAASGAAVVGLFGTAMASDFVPLVKHAAIQFTKVARGVITATAVVSETPRAILDRLQMDGKSDFEVDVTLTDASGATVAVTLVQWHLKATRKLI